MTQEAFAPKIYTVRDEPVVLDSDLALLYGVETRVFNQAISAAAGQASSAPYRIPRRRRITTTAG